MMKYLVTLFVVLTAFFNLSAQNFLVENFDGSIFPPAGWHVDNHPENWKLSASRNALGIQVGEANFSWDPIYSYDTTRLISPVVNTSGCAELYIEFKQYIHFAFGQSVVVGVQTRSNSGSWHTVWTKNLSANVPAERVNIKIENSDVGSENFEFCLFYKGKSYNLRNWYIDDVKLFDVSTHDIEIVNVKSEKYLNAGDTIYPEVTVGNYGIPESSFYIFYEYSDGEGNILLQDSVEVPGLDTLQFITKQLTAFVLPEDNKVYRIRCEVFVPEDENTDNNVMDKYVYTYTEPRENVLLEIGTGVTCGFCPGAAMGADDLIENGHNVAVIEYHYFDHNNDPFSNDFAFVRTDYYGIYAFPTSYFDGTLSYVGGSVNSSLYDKFLPRVEERNTVKTGIKINFENLSVKDDSVIVRVKINKVAPVLDGTYVLHLVITESNIAFEWENQDELDYVERTMLPDAYGTAIDIIDNEELSLDFSINIDPEWDAENLELVAFVQNLYDKEVVNTHKENLLSVGNGEITSKKTDFTVYPNPAKDYISAKFKLNEPSVVSTQLYDMAGKLVASLQDKEFSAGINTVKFNLNPNLKNGLYLLKTTINKKMFTQKFIIQR